MPINYWISYCCGVTATSFKLLKTTHVLSNSFCGSGIQTWLSWVLCCRVSRQGCLQGIRPGVSSAGLPLEDSLPSLSVTRSPASSVRGFVAETRQVHTDYQVLWRKRDGMATLKRRAP